MKKIIQGTIETSYSKETYLCIYDADKHYSEENAVDKFLEEICFCDNWEVIETSPATTKQIEKYNDAIAAAKKIDDIDDFWIRNALLYASGYYETIDEMIQNNKF